MEAGHHSSRLRWVHGGGCAVGCAWEYVCGEQGVCTCYEFVCIYGQLLQQLGVCVRMTDSGCLPALHTCNYVTYDSVRVPESSVVSSLQMQPPSTHNVRGTQRMQSAHDICVKPPFNFATLPLTPYG